MYYSCMKLYLHFFLNYLKGKINNVLLFHIRNITYMKKNNMYIFSALKQLQNIINTVVLTSPVTICLSTYINTNNSNSIKNKSKPHSIVVIILASKAGHCGVQSSSGWAILRHLSR